MRHDLALFFIFGSCIALHAGEKGMSHHEYKIRAAYLYNFLLLTEWPPEAAGQSQNRITLAILGEPEFRREIFLPIAGKVIDNKTVVLKHYQKLEEIEEFRGCFLLYVGQSQAEHVQRLLTRWGILPCYSSAILLVFSTKEA